MSAKVTMLMHGKGEDPVDIVEMDVPDGETMLIDFISGKVQVTSRNPPNILCHCRHERHKGRCAFCTCGDDLLSLAWCSRCEHTHHQPDVCGVAINHTPDGRTLLCTCQ